MKIESREQALGILEKGVEKGLVTPNQYPKLGLYDQLDLSIRDIKKECFWKRLKLLFYSIFLIKRNYAAAYRKVLKRMGQACRFLLKSNLKEYVEKNGYWYLWNEYDNSAKKTWIVKWYESGDHKLPVVLRDLEFDKDLASLKHIIECGTTEKLEERMAEEKPNFGGSFKRGSYDPKQCDGYDIAGRESFASIRKIGADETETHFIRKFLNDEGEVVREISTPKEKIE